MQLAAGKLAHSLEDCVTVGIAFGQNGENQRGSTGGDEVFVDVHRHSMSSAGKLYLELPYIIVLCMSKCPF
jgi:hypothetical protein